MALLPTNYHKPGVLGKFGGDTTLGRMKTVTIIGPAANDNVTMFWTNTAITIANVTSVVSGTSPQVNFTLYTGANRDGASNTVIQANIACSNVTTGVSTTSFSNNTIAANTYVWVHVLTTSGTVNDFHLTLRF